MNEKQQSREAKQLSDQIMNDLGNIAKQIRRYESIVESGNDHDGNALANLRYFQRTLSGIKTHRIRTSY